MGNLLREILFFRKTTRKAGFHFSKAFVKSGVAPIAISPIGVTIFERLVMVLERTI